MMMLRFHGEEGHRSMCSSLAFPFTFSKRRRWAGQKGRVVVDTSCMHRMKNDNVGE